MNKTKLYVIEGQDRAGKDTLVEYIDQRLNNMFLVYKQKCEGLVDYNDKEAFSKWVKNHIQKCIEDLNDLRSQNKNLVITRLLVSDNVYSELFGRDFIVKNNFEKYINDNFDIVNVIVLWRNYSEYLKRLQIINEEIQYTENEFNKIVNLYLKNSCNKDVIIFVDCNDTKEDVYNKFIKNIV